MTNRVDRRRGDTDLMREPLPPQLRLGGERYLLVMALKVDTFAANYLIRRERDDSEHVLKVSRFRYRRLPGIAVALDLETDHEVAIYSRLREVPGVPALTGRPCRFAFLHEFIPGHRIGRDSRLPADFFERLGQILGGVHDRGVAYVDMEKEENVILGDDGRPWLIDFQISLCWPPFLVRHFQREDRRHLSKHKKRLAPATLSEQERKEVADRSAPLRAHRLLTRPYFRMRRWLQGRSGG